MNKASLIVAATHALGLAACDGPKQKAGAAQDKASGHAARKLSCQPALAIDQIEQFSSRHWAPI